MMRRLLLLMLLVLPLSARAQPAPGPPAVGVVPAARQQITETNEFIGRIQAIGRVALVARVTAFLEKRLFVEGAEVKKGDLLYLLEQPPFQAQVDYNKANVAQLEAQHTNAVLTLQRAQYLLRTVAGEQATVDSALAAERALAAQIAAAQAQLEQAEINLGYTEIRAPIDGKISSTVVTEGNVVSPTSGTLANLVSQDPMYVIFPISLRAALELRDRYGPKGGFSAVVIKLRLPTGEIYQANGRLDYVAPTVAQTTDTISLRGVIPNLIHPGMKIGEPGSRELTDGEFVTVLLEGVQPVTVLAIPRSAVLADQQGDYVFVVDAHNEAQQRRIKLGQSTPSTAVVTSGLKPGELVVSEGVQRVRSGEIVSPGPASPPPAIAPDLAGGGAGVSAPAPSNAPKAGR
ncbi:MAG TPA: efflux RND transporter periplasmic adaptor subunit [Stellaceae bacterium]|jgi:membrane fusion protein (multidrug efflux system)|nr:efflux RND transporter periplasmic adaptor subunit [Stellaceae bacterium]